MSEKKSETTVSLRAENGTRTRDPDLGKVVLYQLSYFRVSCNLTAFGNALIAPFSCDCKGKTIF